LATCRRSHLFYLVLCHSWGCLHGASDGWNALCLGRGGANEYEHWRTWRSCVQTELCFESTYSAELGKLIERMLIPKSRRKQIMKNATNPMHQSWREMKAKFTGNHRGWRRRLRPGDCIWRFVMVHNNAWLRKTCHVSQLVIGHAGSCTCLCKHVNVILFRFHGDFGIGSDGSRLHDIDWHWMRKNHSLGRMIWYTQRHWHRMTRWRFNFSLRCELSSMYTIQNRNEQIKSKIKSKQCRTSRFPPFTVHQLFHLSFAYCLLIRA
jgi:hypothetical protein